MPPPLVPWVFQTHPIKDGEEVRQSVANRLPLEMQQRTDYLKALIDSINAGEALYVRNVAVDASVKIGQAVYWDVTALEYKAAIAKVNFDPSIGGFTIADSSYAVGIVTFKYAATRCDILISGLVRNLDFTQAIGTPGNNPADAGAYFLSANQAGHYTKQKPPVGVYILFMRGDGSAHVNPTPRDLLESHIHYAVDLFAEPAGEVECPEPNRGYKFILSDSNRPGWLPADDPVFGGMAPAGAVYGYNLKAHPELDRIWPPIPAPNAYLEANGIGVPRQRWSVDVNGLWWYDDCYTRAPWPTEVRPCGSSSSSESACPFPSSSSSSSSGEVLCDSGPNLEMMGFVRVDPCVKALRLYFTKMVFKTNNSVVTSLRPSPGSPITVTGCDKNTPADTGDLCLGLDLSLSVLENQPGFQVFKDVTGTQFKRGPAVEAIKPGPLITVTPVLGESFVDANGFVYGKMQISAIAPGSDQQELGVALVLLNGVREDSLNNVFFLTMGKDKSSALTGRIILPPTNIIPNPQLELRFWVLGRAAGTLPAMHLSYKRLAEPNGCTPLVLPAVDTLLPDLGVCTLSTPNTYVEILSAQFAVADGEQVFFKLTRDGFNVDGYNADVGILNMSAKLFPG